MRCFRRIFRIHEIMLQIWCSSKNVSRVIYIKMPEIRILILGTREVRKKATSKHYQEEQNWGKNGNLKATQYILAQTSQWKRCSRDLSFIHLKKSDRYVICDLIIVDITTLILNRFHLTLNVIYLFVILFTCHIQSTKLPISKGKQNRVALSIHF